MNPSQVFNIEASPDAVFVVDREADGQIAVSAHTKQGLALRAARSDMDWFESR